MNARKVQHGHGVKGSRDFPKEDYVSKHKPSKIDLKDERVTKVEIRLTHPRRSVMTKVIDLYQLESETRKWEKDNWKVFVNN